MCGYLTLSLIFETMSVKKKNYTVLLNRKMTYKFKGSIATLYLNKCTIQACNQLTT